MGRCFSWCNRTHVLISFITCICVDWRSHLKLDLIPVLIDDAMTCMRVKVGLLRFRIFDNPIEGLDFVGIRWWVLVSSTGAMGHTSDTPVTVQTCPDFWIHCWKDTTKDWDRITTVGGSNTEMIATSNQPPRFKYEDALDPLRMHVRMMHCVHVWCTACVYAAQHACVMHCLHVWYTACIMMHCMHVWCTACMCDALHACMLHCMHVWCTACMYYTLRACMMHAV